MIMKNMHFKIFLTALLLVPVSGYAATEKAAMIEEIIVRPDGTEQVVRRYKPEDGPSSAASAVHFSVPEEYSQPGPRELLPHEKLELDRLEDDFEQGRITPNEYYLRRNRIMQSLYKQTGRREQGAISIDY